MNLTEAFRTAPASVIAIASIEALQRVAYVGGRALMLLMLGKAALDGGFNWGDADALRFFGTFVALYLAAPLFGGLIADRLIGHRRSVGFGLFLLLVGNVLLCASAFLVFHSGGDSLNEAALRNVGIGTMASLGIDDLAIPSGAFLLGTALIVIGNGFYQTCAMSLIGASYQSNDPNRESGFTLHYIGQSAGFLGGALIVGTIGEVFGWAFGFLAASAAMVLAVLLYFAVQNTMPVSAAVERTHERDDGKNYTGRVIVLSVLAFAALVYTVGFEQFMGFVQLFVSDRVDRDVLGMQVPATWYPQLLSVFALLFGGIYVSFQRYLTDRGRQPSVPVKFAVGLLFMVAALSTLSLAILDANASDTNKTGSMIIVISYLLLTVSEIILWPLGFATVERLAPARQKAAWLGVWLLVCASVGSFVAGVVGGQLVTSGGISGLIHLMALCGVCALLLIALKNALVRAARDQAFAGNNEKDSNE